VDSTGFQAFLYRVVTTNRGVETMAAEGLLRAPPSASTLDTDRGLLEYFPAATRAEAVRMGAVYERLYCLENSMRELIESTLLEVLGPEWWANGVPEDIRKKGEKRQQEDARSRWHGPRGDSLLVYADFPELAKIITDRWEDFEDVLGDKTWVERYFSEMNPSRRALAHTGRLTDFDVERMDLRLREWLQVVG
jgi:hypothetical protein